MSPLPSLAFLNHLCHHFAGAVAENFPNPRTHPDTHHSERHNVLEGPGTPRSRKLSFLAAGTREPNSHQSVSEHLGGRKWKSDVKSDHCEPRTAGSPKHTGPQETSHPGPGVY